jgi:peptidoglycan/LPS O-acetylase OafA/YrhL
MTGKEKNIFRTDINGLRAYAVLFVILFHFDIPGFSGGFIGVDIFFVISGFLMTQILVNSMNKIEISSNVGWLLNFYIGRAKRIAPALIILCGVLLAIGWFFLLSYDLRKLAAQTVAALTFLSNIKFWGDGDGGYFDASVQYKPLLHTWSLSVEWQFYLLYPLLLLCIWRLFQSTRSRFITVTALLIISFILSATISSAKPAFAFYLLPTRAWELLAGALVFMAPKFHPKKNILDLVEAAGFLLILSSVFIFDDKIVWPGYLALLPVLGSMLILFAERQDSPWFRPTAIQALGTWSYSAYLWHWPMVVALAYFELLNDWRFSIPTLVLSILFGWASYVLIETSTRRALSRLTPVYASASIAIAAFGIILPALVIHKMNGAPQRTMPFNLSQFDASFHPRRDECSSIGNSFKSCIYGEGVPKALLVGDSHAGSAVTAVQLALPSNTSLVSFSYPGCTTLFNKQTTSPCDNFNEKALYQLTRSFDSKIPLIIANRTDDSNSDYINNIVTSVCLVTKNREVWLMRPIPEMPLDVPRVAAYRSLFNRSPDDISVSLSDYHHRHNFVWKAQDKAAAQCGAHILDPLPYLCNTTKCDGLRDGRPLYYDANHLSEYGNKIIAPMFHSIFVKK